jgi:RNA polymerase sigma factor (sigma-70 family)
MSARSDLQMGDQAEQLLIDRAKRGDRAAFERLLGPALLPATRLAYAMLQDRSEAEDVFQEAALRAWRRLANLRVGARFQPWFIGIVANQCREVRRGHWWRLVRIADVFTSDTPDEAAWLEGEDLRRAVHALPHDQRVAVLLHFHLDMAVTDVSVVLGISPAGVRTRIKRALKRLRPAMQVSEAKVNG